MEDIKMTKREKFEKVAEILRQTPDGLEYVDFIQDQVALIDKRNAKAKEKAQEKKVMGDELRGEIESVLTLDYKNISMIKGELEAKGIEDVTPAKITARLKQLIDAGVAEKDQIKIGDASRPSMCYKRV